MRRLGISTICMAGFVVFFGLAVGLQRNQLQRMRAEPHTYHDWLYLPSSQYVKWTTLGFDQFTADLLWLRSIQAFGASMAQKQELGALYNYFDVITDLDPQFLAVYTFANMVIGEEARDHVRGLKILEKGMTENPRKYRLPYDAAFFSYWTMDDPKLGKYYTTLAIKAPDCPAFVRGWEAYFDSKMGKYQAAVEKYFAEYAHYFRAGDAVMMQNKYSNFRKAMTQWIVAEIRSKALEFHAREGRHPTVSELEQLGAFKESELPDWPAFAQFILGITNSENGVLPEDPTVIADLMRTKFVRKGWDRLPPCPSSDHPSFRGYIIWPGQEPMNPVKEGQKAEDVEQNDHYCISEIAAVKFIVERSLIIETWAVEHQKRANQEGCPPTLDSFMPNSELVDDLIEPWGGRWIWDAENCKFYPSTFPNLTELYRQAPLI